MGRQLANMPARPFVCLACRRTLGTISRKRDHRGKPYDKLRLNDNVQHVGRELFRGKYALCQCGERTKLPENVTVEFH